MEKESFADRAASGSQRRTRILFAELFLFVVWQGTFFTWGGAERLPARAVDQVKLSAWLLWCLVLLALVATGGGWSRSREVRALMNDESSTAYRHEGQRWGFWGAAVAAVALYVARLFEPIGALDTLHAILTVAIGLALGRYAYLERRAERVGGA